MPPLTKSDSLGDALSAAMSAVELGGEAFQQLSAAENSYVGQASGAPTQLHKDRLIGEGGYSLVWLVHEEGDASKKYALKQMHKASLLKRKTGCEVAYREKTAYEDIRAHPFVIQCHGFYQDSLSLYLLLELCVMDLFELLQLHADAKGRLTQECTRVYVGSIALALRHMHQTGYVYRDLKPENVLIDTKGYVKLADLGAAKKVDKSRTFTALGTEEYIPPEQVRGRGRTIASDWWALGVLLFELLMGRPPFEGATSTETLSKVVKFGDAGEVGRNTLRQAMLTALGEGAADAAELTVGLLHVWESMRLGCTPEGFLGIWSHPWFASLDWVGLFNQQVPPPHVPPPSRMNTDFSSEVDPESMIAEAVDPASGPMFEAFGPRLDVPAHASESSR
eukprot:Transcript_20446.p1 GENE.Transcript_20446~~Transcript_20446.p1  ORF type:complete len:393 (+),score=153.94 Transcript_20446:108-1286(+)